MRPSYRWRRGDRWVFFTDGITDRQAPDGTMFDLERLCRGRWRSIGAKTPAAIVDAIVGELDAFSGGQEPEDDQTLLVDRLRNRPCEPEGKRSQVWAGPGVCSKCCMQKCARPASPPTFTRCSGSSRAWRLRSTARKSCLVCLAARRWS